MTCARYITIEASAFGHLANSMRILFVNQFYDPDAAANAQQMADTGHRGENLPRADCHMEPGQNSA